MGDHSSRNPGRSEKQRTAGYVVHSELCVAVGRYVTKAGTEETLGERLSGLLTEWNVVESLNPAEAKSSSLTSVSCITLAPDCMAVGHYVTAAGTEKTLSETFDGTENKWAIVTPVTPAEAKSSSLAGVSCSGLGCEAVGRYVSGAGTELTLGEKYSIGTNEWTLQESATPAGAKGSSLAGLSCVSEAECTAVGHYVNSGGTEVTLGELITGATKKWTVQETPNPTGAKSAALSGVLCTGTEACTAVGHYVNSASFELALAEVFTKTAKKWALQEIQDPKEVATGGLAGVSCSATEACTGVGHYHNSSGTEVTLAERWNGKEWAFQESPNPTGAKSASLSGVSCTAAEACTAVGHYVTSGGVESTLAEVWSAKKWTIQETTNPTGAKSASLSSVSCTAAEACTAVAHFVNSGSTEVTLAEVFTSTAKKWAIQESPNPTGAKSSSLSGVSCTAAEACTAVGHFVNSGGTEVTLGEVFTSATKKWAVQEPPNPVEAKSSSLSGVSCTSTTACTAVGHYVSSTSVELKLGETWNGTAWSIKETPNPTGAKSSSLSGVSCTAAEACTAVGHYVNSGNTEVTLVEVFTSETKKWAIQESPNPAEAKSSSLSGVSCKTATACIAVGHKVEGPEGVLVEEHS